MFFFCFGRPPIVCTLGLFNQTIHHPHYTYHCHMIYSYDLLLLLLLTHYSIPHDYNNYYTCCCAIGTLFQLRHIYWYAMQHVIYHHLNYSHCFLYAYCSYSYNYYNDYYYQYYYYYYYSICYH